MGYSQKLGICLKAQWAAMLLTAYLGFTPSREDNLKNIRFTRQIIEFQYSDW